MNTAIPRIADLAILPAAFAQAETTKMTAGDIKAMQASTAVSHGEIKKIDPAMLKQLQVGNKVNVVADMVNGAPTVTKIKQAK